jgi:hypothetical protein
VRRIDGRDDEGISGAGQTRSIGASIVMAWVARNIGSGTIVSRESVELFDEGCEAGCQCHVAEECIRCARMTDRQSHANR